MKTDSDCCPRFAQSTNPGLLGVAATLIAAALMALAFAPPASAARHHGMVRVKLGRRPLWPHRRGTDVRQLQRDLTRLKQPASPDGIYGKATFKSVRRLERHRRWYVDGRVGRREAEWVKRAVQRQRDQKHARMVSSAGTAQLLPDGTAVAPANTPLPVRNAIDAGNRIHTKPYIWGGGHGAFESKGYDCSGAVSYVLHAAGLLPYPMASGALRHWGYPGNGAWITVYANKSHAWMTVAGLRFDTSAVGESLNQGSGPRWRVHMRSGDGYAIRFSPGL
ncbi:MAG: peptidoglycan-binding domain-containing protein [Solirubrobacterales bacterium]